MPLVSMADSSLLTVCYALLSLRSLPPGRYIAPDNRARVCAALTKRARAVYSRLTSHYAHLLYDSTSDNGYAYVMTRRLLSISCYVLRVPCE